MKRILLCITGASGAIYGVRLLRKLKKMGHEVHLILSSWGTETLEHEMGMKRSELEKEADKSYDETDMAAGPASGSFPLDAMAVVPCSMKTLAGIANGYAENLILRAADCSLKEERPLVLVPREAPYNLVHVENMRKVLRAGSSVLPASPAFWHKPESIESLVDSIVDRVLVHIGIEVDSDIEWDGMPN
ncbi:MAG: UbiX family flavin prenyltransferase [Candidatus Lokiarchaeota archaeon]|nr:UbiX family flavin prenyltransferase [Candidatus Lokiarchaeota archaeon]